MFSERIFLLQLSEASDWASSALPVKQVYSSQEVRVALS